MEDKFASATECETVYGGDDGNAREANGHAGALEVADKFCGLGGVSALDFFGNAGKVCTCGECAFGLPDDNGFIVCFCTVDSSHQVF